MSHSQDSMVASVVERVRAWRHRPAVERLGPLWATVRPAWHSALRIASFGRGFEHTLNGTHRVRLAIDQAPHAAPIFWEPEHYAAVMAAVRWGSHVIDVGAFIGLYAVGAAIRAGETGCVVAIEPSPVTARRLRSNVKVNGLGRVVRVVEAVCADRPGSCVPFHVNAGGGMTDSAVPDATHSATLSRTTTAIDALVGEFGLQPAVIKIDVEGFEDLVVRGATETLRRFDPVIFVELHADKLEQRGSSANEVVQCLISAGFTCTDIRVGRPALLPPGTLLEFRRA